MFNKPMNFIRMLNIENGFFFKLEFSNVVANYFGREVMKTTKFQFNI